MTVTPTSGSSTSPRGKAKSKRTVARQVRALAGPVRVAPRGRKRPAAALRRKIRRLCLLAAAVVLTGVAAAAWRAVRVTDCSVPHLWHSSGISMEPLIHAGDLEISSDTAFAALARGMIVIFRPQAHWTKAHYVCHRIVGGWAGKWVTRGDNNPVADPGYLTAENYVSTVRLIVHARHLPE